MVFTVCNYKGGTSKTTTAVHLAAVLAERLRRDSGAALSLALVDGDPNRSALAWANRSRGTPTPFPFEAYDEKRLVWAARQYEHLVIDTEARPTSDDVQELVESCDLLVVPTSPEGMSLETTLQTIQDLQGVGARNYCVLLTMVPANPASLGDDAEAFLVDEGVPVAKVLRRRVRRASAIADAPSQGVLVKDVRDVRRRKPKAAGPAWSDYLAVGDEILGLAGHGG